MTIRTLVLAKGERLWLDSIKEGGYYSPPLYRELYEFEEILTEEDVAELELVCYSVYKLNIDFTLEEWRERKGQLLIIPE